MHSTGESKASRLLTQKINKADLQVLLVSFFIGIC